MRRGARKAFDDGLRESPALRRPTAREALSHDSAAGSTVVLRADRGYGCEIDLNASRPSDVPPSNSGYFDRN